MTTAVVHVPLNTEGYKKMREEITTEVILIANMELDTPQADDLAKVYEAVFKKALDHIKTITAAHATGKDVQEYITVVAGIIQNAGLLGEKIQGINLMQKEMDQYEKQAYEEIEDITKEPATV